MNATTLNVGAILPAQVFQSRWGYHPVSRDVDKKLRFLNTVHQKSLHMAKAWKRWDAKAPHNRVQKPRLRDASGQVIGYGDPVPWNEPEICPVFSKKVTKKVTWHPTKGYYKDGIDLTTIEVTGPDILSAARQARSPYPTAEAVRPLPLKVEEIDRLYEEAKEWLASR